MRIFPIADPVTELPELVAAHAVADYIYMYPPRQAYRPVDPRALASAVATSLARTDAVDLYLHFPFCRQICAFCNLYAVVSTDDDVFSAYIKTITREAHHYSQQVHGKRIDTVYLGGGTPSQIKPALFDVLLADLEELYGFSRADVPEVAIEMAPDTVTAERLAGYVAAGINRVNLGVQTADDAELHSIGRRQTAALTLRAVETALAAGFDNVCVDLIYGLAGQDFDSWCRSVDAVIALDPPTVCAYALTLRPWTGFAARGYDRVEGTEQTAKYNYADTALRDAGYRQETHVRWAKGTGGYLQKENHWALGTILGLGAGARAYLWDCDYRNGYGGRRRRPVLQQWCRQVTEQGHGRVDGYLMDDGERRRKAIILGLHNLDLARFETLFDATPQSLFPQEFQFLIDGGFGELHDGYFRLTPLGMCHRDILVQPFISHHVRTLSLEGDIA